MTSFADLGLSAPVAVRAEGYTTPSRSRRWPSPPSCRPRPAGCAQTGTGKTAAFALPILHRLPVRRRRPPRRPKRAARWSCTHARAGDPDPRELRAYGRNLGSPCMSCSAAWASAAGADRWRAVSISSSRRRAVCSTTCQRNDPARPRGLRPRRGRPHARHGLHPRRAEGDELRPAKRQTLFFSATCCPRKSTGARAAPGRSGVVEAKPIASTADLVEQRCCSSTRRQAGPARAGCSGRRGRPRARVHAY